MKATRYLAVVPLVAVLSGCETLTVPDLNNPGVDELTDNPTREAVIGAAQGLFLDARTGIAGRAGYVSSLGVIGRESYNFDRSDPRFTTQLLIGPLDGGTPAFGGAHWNARYSGMRDAFTLLNAVDEVPDVDMTEEERNGVRGFARTMQALDLLFVINTRDENGAVVTINEDPRAEPAPIVSKAEVFDDIVALLDQAGTDLQGAGGSFPFRMPAGFNLAGDPASFLQFNRALRARVDVYMGNYADALTNLNASFLNDGAPFNMGVYYDYGSGRGETQNLLFDPSLVLLAHPSIEADAQMRGNGDPDLRFTSKTTRLAGPRSDQASQGISSDLQFTVYASPESPVPIIRNEELILLRAEANLACTGDAGGVTCAGDPAGALDDINLVRQVAGGLGPIDAGDWTGMTDEERLDELLYNKRYSLIFEGGHRWIDARRYGKLDELPLDQPTFTVAERYPFPTPECDARANPPAQGC